MASKIGDENRLVSTPSLFVAQPLWPRKTMWWLLSRYRHHRWSGGKFENASENAGIVRAKVLTRPCARNSISIPRQAPPLVFSIILNVSNQEDVRYRERRTVVRSERANFGISKVNILLVIDKWGEHIAYRKYFIMWIIDIWRENCKYTWKK